MNLQYFEYFQQQQNIELIYASTKNYNYMRNRDKENMRESEKKRTKKPNMFYLTI